MEALTIAIAVVCSISVLFVRPFTSFGIYSVAILLYPQSLRVPLGTIDFSTGRIIILVLIVKLCCCGVLTKLKLIWLDRWVLLFFIAQVIAGIQTTPFAKLVENRAGDFVDMALPYFVARICITSWKELKTYLKLLTVFGCVLTVFSIYESLTGRNLLAFGRWLSIGERMGLVRATVTFNHPIYYGVFMGMIGTTCLALYTSRKKAWGIAAAVSFVGAFNSMSSGGLMTIIMGAGFICLFRFRKNWKNMILGTFLLIILIEIGSNRHFYNVVDRFTFNTRNAWYRARLIEVAFWEGGMTGHWLCGYGFEDPMWCLKIDGRKHTDMVNHFLLVLCRNGLIGLIPFLVIIALAYKEIYKGYFKYNKQGQWIKWCQAAGLFSVLMAMNSVSLFGQPMSFFFIFIALTTCNLSSESYFLGIQYPKDFHYS